MPPNSVSSIVCDPPYGLSKQPDIRKVLERWLEGSEYRPSGGGVYGAEWDSFVPGPAIWQQALRVLKPGGYLVAFSGPRTVDLTALSLRLGGFEIRDMLQWFYGNGLPKSMNLGSSGSGWDGWGTALKPCHEPIILCRKPLDGTHANNVTKHGVGGLNIDKCRVGTERMKKEKSTGVKKGDRLGKSGGNYVVEVIGYNVGRWPSNVAHDGCLPPPMDRYFYSAKASRKDRDAGLDVENPHPAVKPTELMRWLCRLVTPPGGLILDPFAGSGSTGRGAVLEGFKFLGFELDPKYAEIARARILDAE